MTIARRGDRRITSQGVRLSASVIRRSYLKGMR
jgi:hypothetical protein